MVEFFFSLGLTSVCLYRLNEGCEATSIKMECRGLCVDKDKKQVILSKMDRFDKEEDSNALSSERNSERLQLEAELQVWWLRSSVCGLINAKFSGLRQNQGNKRFETTRPPLSLSLHVDGQCLCCLVHYCTEK